MASSDSLCSPCVANDDCIPRPQGNLWPELGEGVSEEHMARSQVDSNTCKVRDPHSNDKNQSNYQPSDVQSPQELTEHKRVFINDNILTSHNTELSELKVVHRHTYPHLPEKEYPYGDEVDLTDIVSAITDTADSCGSNRHQYNTEEEIVGSNSLKCKQGYNIDNLDCQRLQGEKCLNEAQDQIQFNTILFGQMHNEEEDRDPEEIKVRKANDGQMYYGGDNIDQEKIKEREANDGQLHIEEGGSNQQEIEVRKVRKHHLHYEEEDDDSEEIKANEVQLHYGKEDNDNNKIKPSEGQMHFGGEANDKNVMRAREVNANQTRYEVNNIQEMEASENKMHYNEVDNDQEVKSSDSCKDQMHFGEEDNDQEEIKPMGENEDHRHNEDGNEEKIKDNEGQINYGNNNNQEAQMHNLDEDNDQEVKANEGQMLYGEEETNSSEANEGWLYYGGKGNDKREIKPVGENEGQVHYGEVDNDCKIKSSEACKGQMHYGDEDINEVEITASEVNNGQLNYGKDNTEQVMTASEASEGEVHCIDKDNNQENIAIESCQGEAHYGDKVNDQEINVGQIRYGEEYNQEEIKANEVLMYNVDEDNGQEIKLNDNQTFYKEEINSNESNESWIYCGDNVDSDIKVLGKNEGQLQYGEENNYEKIQTSKVNEGHMFYDEEGNNQEMKASEANESPINYGEVDNDQENKVTKRQMYCEKEEDNQEERQDTRASKGQMHYREEHNDQEEIKAVEGQMHYIGDYNDPEEIRASEASKGQLQYRDDDDDDDDTAKEITASSSNKGRMYFGDEDSYQADIKASDCQISYQEKGNDKEESITMEGRAHFKDEDNNQEIETNEGQILYGEEDKIQEIKANESRMHFSDDNSHDEFKASEANKSRMHFGENYNDQEEIKAIREHEGQVYYGEDNINQEEIKDSEGQIKYGGEYSDQKMEASKGQMQYGEENNEEEEIDDIGANDGQVPHREVDINQEEIKVYEDQKQYVGEDNDQEQIKTSEANEGQIQYRAAYSDQEMEASKGQMQYVKDKNDKEEMETSAANEGHMQHTHMHCEDDGQEKIIATVGQLHFDKVDNKEIKTFYGQMQYREEGSNQEQVKINEGQRQYEDNSDQLEIKAIREHEGQVHSGEGNINQKEIKDNEGHMHFRKEHNDQEEIKANEGHMHFRKEHNDQEEIKAGEGQMHYIGDYNDPEEIRASEASKGQLQYGDDDDDDDDTAKEITASSSNKGRMYFGDEDSYQADIKASDCQISYQEKGNDKEESITMEGRAHFKDEDNNQEIETNEDQILYGEEDKIQEIKSYESQMHFEDDKSYSECKASDANKSLIHFEGKDYDQEETKAIREHEGQVYNGEDNINQKEIKDSEGQIQYGEEYSDQEIEASKGQVQYGEEDNDKEEMETSAANDGQVHCREEDNDQNKIKACGANEGPGHFTDLDNGLEEIESKRENKDHKHKEKINTNFGLLRYEEIDNDQNIKASEGLVNDGEENKDEEIKATDGYMHYGEVDNYQNEMEDISEHKSHVHYEEEDSNQEEIEAIEGQVHYGGEDINREVIKVNESQVHYIEENNYLEEIISTEENGGQVLYGEEFNNKEVIKVNETNKCPMHCEEDNDQEVSPSEANAFQMHYRKDVYDQEKLKTNEGQMRYGKGNDENTKDSDSQKHYEENNGSEENDIEHIDSSGADEGEIYYEEDTDSVHSELEQISTGEADKRWKHCEKHTHINEEERDYYSEANPKEESNIREVEEVKIQYAVTSRGKTSDQDEFVIPEESQLHDLEDSRSKGSDQDQLYTTEADDVIHDEDSDGEDSDLQAFPKAEESLVLDGESRRGVIDLEPILITEADEGEVYCADNASQVCDQEGTIRENVEEGKDCSNKAKTLEDNTTEAEKNVCETKNHGQKCAPAVEDNFDSKEQYHKQICKTVAKENFVKEGQEKDTEAEDNFDCNSDKLEIPTTVTEKNLNDEAKHQNQTQSFLDDSRIQMNIDKQEPQTRVDSARHLHNSECREAAAIDKAGVDEYTHSTSEEHYHSQTQGQYKSSEGHCGYVTQGQQHEGTQGHSNKHSKESSVIVDMIDVKFKTLSVNDSGASGVEPKLSTHLQTEQTKCHPGKSDSNFQLAETLTVCVAYSNGNSKDLWSEVNVNNGENKIHSEFSYEDSVASTSQTLGQSPIVKDLSKRPADWTAFFENDYSNLCLKKSITPINVSNNANCTVSGCDVTDFEGFEVRYNEKINALRQILLNVKSRRKGSDFMQNVAKKFRGRKTKGGMKNKGKNKIRIIKKVGRKKTGSVMSKKTKATRDKAVKDKIKGVGKSDGEGLENTVGKIERQKDDKPAVRVGIKNAKEAGKKIKRENTKGALGKKQTKANFVNSFVSESSFKNVKTEIRLAEKAKTKSRSTRIEHKKAKKNSKSKSLSRKESDDYYILQNRSKGSEAVLKEDQNPVRKTRSYIKKRINSTELKTSDNITNLRKRKLSPDIDKSSNWDSESGSSKKTTESRVKCGEIIVAYETEPLKMSLSKKQLRTRKPGGIIIAHETEALGMNVFKKQLRTRKPGEIMVAHVTEPLVMNLSKKPPRSKKPGEIIVAHESEPLGMNLSKKPPRTKKPGEVMVAHKTEPLGINLSKKPPRTKKPGEVMVAHETEPLGINLSTKPPRTKKPGEVIVAHETEPLGINLSTKPPRTKKPGVIMVAHESEPLGINLSKKQLRTRNSVVQLEKKITRGRAKRTIQISHINETYIFNKVEAKQDCEDTIRSCRSQPEVDVDDELPDLTASPLLQGKTKVEFKPGDLVWSMERGVWWPSYVERIYSGNKASVYFIGYKQEAGIKVSFNKIKTFQYGNVPSFVDRGKSGFSAALHITESYCQLQEHGINISVKEFFSMPPEEQDALIIVSLTPKEDPFLASPSIKRKFDEDVDNVTPNTKKILNYEVDDKMMSSRDRKKLQSAIKARRRENEKLLKFMQSTSCMDHLWQIFNGEKPCGRHGLYQDEITRRTLLMSGIGPFQLDQDDDQILSVVDFLVTELNKKRPDFHLARDYVFHVWMPEAIKEALRVINKIPENELELALDEGYRETQTEKKARRLDFT